MHLITFLSTLVSALPNFEQITPHQSLGSSRVTLDGNCQRYECNLGNFIADAMVDWNAQNFNGTVGWTDAAIALIDGDSIKESVGQSDIAAITSVQVNQILEGSKIVAVEVTGQQLVQALEHAVAKFQPGTKADYDEFLQNSGLYVEYDMSKPANERVIGVQITCADCTSPEIFDINLTRTYRVLMPESLADGDHDFTMFENKMVKDLGVTDKEVFTAYLAKKSPIYPAVEWRVTIMNNAASLKISIAIIFMSVLMSIFGKKL